MKNLPDDELFRKLKLRLANYEEQPGDDVWDAVSLAISKSEPAWIRRAERAALLCLMLAAIFTWSSLETSRAPLKNPPAARAANGSPLTQATDKTTDRTDGGAVHSMTPASPSGKDAPGIDVAGQVITGKNAATRRTSQDAMIAPAEHSSSDHTEINPVYSTSSPSSSPAHSDRGSVTVQQLTQEAVLLSSAHKIDAGESEVAERMPADSAVLIPGADHGDKETAVVISPAARRGNSLRAYALLTPSLAFQQVNPSTSDDVTFASLNSPGVLSKERFSFSFEGGVQFPIANRLALFTGISYYQQTTNMSLDELVAGSRGLPGGGSYDYLFEPKTEARVIQYDLRNIGATAGISYVISLGKITHQIGGGLQYEYGMLKKTMETNNVHSGHYLNYRIFYRAEYSVNDRLSVFIQPTFSRSLLYDNVLDGALRIKQTRAGIGFGLLYRF